MTHSTQVLATLQEVRELPDIIVTARRLPQPWPAVDPDDTFLERAAKRADAKRFLAEAAVPSAFGQL